MVNVLLQNVLSVIPTLTVPPFIVNVLPVLLIIPVVAAPKTESVLPVTASVPPVLMVTVPAVATAPFTVTVCVFKIFTTDVAKGALPISQVLPVSHALLL